MTKTYIEYRGVYDGALVYFLDGDESKLYHRIDDKLILEQFQLEEYSPIFFKTENGYFRNLFKITKEEFETSKKKFEKKSKKL